MLFRYTKGTLDVLLDIIVVSNDRIFIIANFTAFVKYQLLFHLLMTYYFGIWIYHVEFAS